MANQFNISLRDVRFRAFHGLYPEERQKGNDFVVNMDVWYAGRETTITGLEETVDYAVLFDIINTWMQLPVDLLETLAQKIVGTVHEKFPRLKKITVTIEKLNPPIDKFTGTAAVTYSAEY